MQNLGITRLESFMRTNGIKPAELAREARISRGYLYKIRSGKAGNFGILTAVRIRDACSRLTLRRVSIAEVFDVK
jgi:predicted transcriptional regulator